jgi:RNA polymerase sigma factor (sigma-70 family)
MDAAVERDLAQRAQRGDRAALDELCAAHDPFCRSRAGHYVRHYPHLDRDDCLQAARIGLLVAIRRFDVARGTRLLTVAWHAVRTELLDLRLKTARLGPRSRRAAGAPIPPPPPRVVFFSELNDSSLTRMEDAVAFVAVDDWPWPVSREEFAAAVDSLPTADRDLLRARWRGETLDAIGRRLGRVAEAVRKRQERAEQRLTDRLVRRSPPCPAS